MTIYLFCLGFHYLFRKSFLCNLYLTSSVKCYLQGVVVERDPGAGRDEVQPDDIAFVHLGETPRQEG